MDLKDYRMDINTMDAYKLIKSGMLVLVTNYFTSKDIKNRNFMQRFFGDIDFHNSMKCKR